MIKPAQLYKEEIKKKAAAAGQSVNEYINALIDNDK